MARSAASLARLQVMVIGLDGACLLCQRAAHLIVARDHHRQCYLVAQQDDLATVVFPPQWLTQPPSSIVLRCHPRRNSDQVSHHRGADAVLTLGLQLQPHCMWWHLARCLPSWLLEVGYRALAKRRYRWFGQAESCRLPSGPWRQWQS